MESLLSWIWKIIQGLVEAGIKLFGNVLMGFCSIALKLVNATSSGKVTVDGKQENIYTYICHAFNPVFWFSKKVLIPFGLAILTIVLIWSLSKIIMSGQKGTKDDPISLVRRTIVAGVFIYLTPYLILFGIGTDINTAGKYTDYNYRKVVSADVSGMQVMPTLLDGLSSFDGDGTGKLKLSNNNIDALKNSSDKNDAGFEATNVNILIKGVAELGIDNVTKDDIGLGAKDSTTEINNGDDEDPVKNAYSSLSGKEIKATAKSKGIPLTKKVKDKNGKKKKVKKTDTELLNDLVKNEYTMSDGDNSVLGTLSQSMYSEYGNSGWAKGIVWKIIYVIVFLIQPALIIWNLVQMLWVFVKRAVSLILSACLAPVAIAFYPSQSTSEVTSKWIKMVLGYGMTTALTFAFVKLGAFVYASIIQVQYREESLILTVVLNFACLAILGFIKEMESYANNLGGNLVTFKNGISGQLGKMAARWGERGLFLPLGLGAKAMKMAPKAAGFATGKQGFFSRIGKRNLDKGIKEQAKDTIHAGKSGVEKVKNRVSRPKLLKNPALNDTISQGGADLTALHSFNRLGGGAITSDTIKDAPLRQNNIAEVKDGDALAKYGENFLTLNGHGIDEAMLGTNNANIEPAGGGKGLKFTPPAGTEEMFNQFKSEDGNIYLNQTPNAPTTKVSKNGKLADITHSNGTHSIIDTRSDFDKLQATIPNTTLNRDFVVKDIPNSNSQVITNGNNVFETSGKTISSDDFNNLDKAQRQGYSAYVKAGDTGYEVVYAKKGIELTEQTLNK